MNRIDLDCRDHVETSLLESQTQSSCTGEKVDADGTSATDHGSFLPWTADRRPVWSLLGHDEVKTGSEMPVLRQSRPPNFVFGRSFAPLDVFRKQRRVAYFESPNRLPV
jgi:hypothetical protein